MKAAWEVDTALELLSLWVENFVDEVGSSSVL